MNIKFYLLIIFLFIFTKTLYPDIKTKSVIPHEPGFVPSSPRYINIYAHIIRNSSGGEGISLDDVNISIQQLNDQFSNNNAMIVFELNGWQYIDNDDYVYIETQTEAQEIWNNNSVDMHINVYYVKYLYGGGCIAVTPGVNCIIKNVEATNEYSLAHEIGHNLWLYHTFETMYGIERINRVDLPDCPKNWDSAGDFIEDTPADPGYGFDITTDCEWNPLETRTDPCGNTNYDPDTHNIMSYYFYTNPACINHFTPQQIERMHWALVNYWPMSYLIRMEITYWNKYISQNISGTTLSQLNDWGEWWNFNSGEDPSFVKQEVEYTVRTDHERFLDYQSVNIKHHDWDDNNSEYHLVENFIASKNSPDRIANFIEMKPVVIKNHLISANSDASKINFHDPWYVDQNGNQLDDFQENLYSPYYPKGKHGETVGGVFLNQGGDDINNLIPPYYSVRADNEQTINGNRLFFGYWKASGAQLQNTYSHTSAVVFNQPDAEVSAYYNKGHLLTNLSRAYNHNSQRKLLLCNGKYHTVYIEDMFDPEDDLNKNVLWHTHSASDGFQGDWAQEEKLNESVDDIKNPSMDYYDNTQDVKLYIVYEIGGEYDTDQYYASLLLTEYNTTNGSYSTELIADFYDIQNADLEPVIARSQYNMFIVWRDPNQSKLVYKHKYLSGQTHQWEWSSITPIPNTTSKSKHPSIVCEKHINQPQHFHLVWDENSGSEIRYYRIKPNEVNGDVNFDNYCKISQGSGYSKNRHPSISLNGGNYPVVSWTGAKRSLPPIDGLSKTADPYSYIYNAVLRSKGSSGWGSFFNTGSEVDYTNCNSTSNANQMETVMTYSKSDGQSCKWIRKVNSSYTYGSLDVNGIQTQLSNGSLSSMKAVVFDNNGSAPHYLKRSDTDFNQGLSKPSAKESTSYARQAVVTKDNIEFVYHIGDVHLGKKYISFYDFPDTVVIKDEDHLNQVTKSKPFYLDSNSELYLSEQYYTVNGDKSKSVLTKTDNIYFKLELVKNDSRQVVALLNDINFNKESIDKLDFTDYKFDCSGLEKGKYFIRIKTNMKGKGKYFVGNEQQNINELQKISYNEQFVTKNVLPSTFSLKQNYPNPFNPVTNIAFDLPEDSQVKLMIYNIHGQLITTLVDDYRKAGRHEVAFHGNSLASGIYFYRIKAGSFSEIKRMLLVK